MNLSYSSKTIKYLIFGLNFFLVISGIVIIAVGATVKSVYTDYSYFLDDKYFSLPNMLIATGSLIFFISFFGCCGAFRESWIMLGIFSILLGIIFIFEFSAGIAGYVLRDKTLDYLDRTLSENLKQYEEQSHSIWDLIQGKFECCGANDPDDWKDVFGNSSLPISCCPSQSGTVGSFYCNSEIIVNTTSAASTSSTVTVSTTETTNSTTETTSISTSTGTKDASTQSRRKREILDPLPESTTQPYARGCKTAFGSFIKTHAVQIGGCAMGLAIIQILGIGFSCYMVRQLKNSYYST